MWIGCAHERFGAPHRTTHRAFWFTRLRLAHGYNPRSGRPAVSSRPRARLAHWMAWPLPPFTRLSMAHSDTAQPVRGSTRAVTCAVFDPRVALVDGEPSVT